MYQRIITRGIAAPSRRPLKIFAADPMLGRTFGNRARVDIPNEVVQPGPIGQRIAVIDYDGARKCFYEPVDLDNPSLLMQGGLDPSESDPRFHQQMVYAVAMKTIENFDRALGRQLKLSSRKFQRLRLFPHAFYGANAYYARKLNAILFGYFRADRKNPGGNLPGQIVYTCLSHDVIAHELTHKIVDRLRPLFLEPSNEDVLAFHEGFSDIVALFQHFSFPDVLREHIAHARGDVTTSGTAPLAELAQQFGYATGTGKSLRSALDKPDAKLYETLFEPHDRGAILVAAMFDGFNKAYQRRIADLVRIATGGSGVLPSGHMHPDLVNRIANEASRIAQRVLDMSIRAFDYLPPVDVNFGDFLRAMVTADYELIPEDDLHLRSAMIEAFRLRGIYPTGVASLAEESLLWETARDPALRLPEDVIELLQQLFFSAVLDFDTQIAGDDSPPPSRDPGAKGLRQRFEEQEVRQSFIAAEQSDGDLEVEVDVGKEMASRLTQYASSICGQLGLDPNLTIQTRGFHPVFRVAPNGRLVIELIAQFAQQDRSRKDELGGLPLRGGATMVFGADGQVRYIIRKSMPGAQVPEHHRKHGAARLAQQQGYVAHIDARNPGFSYMEAVSYAERIARMADFARLHHG